MPWFHPKWPQSCGFMTSTTTPNFQHHYSVSFAVVQQLTNLCHRDFETLWTYVTWGRWCWSPLPLLYHHQMYSFWIRILSKINPGEITCYEKLSFYFYFLWKHKTINTTPQLVNSVVDGVFVINPFILINLIGRFSFCHYTSNNFVVVESFITLVIVFFISFWINYGSIFLESWAYQCKHTFYVLLGITFIIWLFCFAWYDQISTDWFFAIWFFSIRF